LSTHVAANNAAYETA
jgi:trimeric autotransporter adhesin